MLRDAERITVGKPIRISELPPARVRGHDWHSLLQSIPRGYAQQVAAAYGTVKTAIQRLEKRNVIPKDEFSLRTRKQGKRTLVYILHHDVSTRTEEKPTTRELAIPQIKLEDVERFILGRPSDYEHTLGDIQTQFFGRVLLSRDDASDYHRSYNVARRAREEIERRLGGKFTEQSRSDGVKVYRFQKDA